MISKSEPGGKPGNSNAEFFVDVKVLRGGSAEKSSLILI